VRACAYSLEKDTQHALRPRANTDLSNDGCKEVQLVPVRTTLPKAKMIYIKQTHTFQIQSDWFSRVSSNDPSIALPCSVSGDDGYSFQLYALCTESVPKDSRAHRFYEHPNNRLNEVVRDFVYDYNRIRFDQFIRYYWHNNDDGSKVARFVDHRKKLAFAIIACRHQSRLYAWIEPLPYKKKAENVAKIILLM